MKSNYKRIGDYIQLVDERNKGLKVYKLLGININKHFMPSVANIVGTDLSNYKIVQKNQFACNRMHVGRDYRIPIAISDIESPFIVSPAYDVFEIKDSKILMPDYLMMWFSRLEFDRNAWFYTDADVRGGLAWKAFEDMLIPIPSIEKQREIVEEYNTIQNRITLNQTLIKKLEETAQAIYKEWFVDFEFPNEEGKPYKSSGGEMVWCEELGKEIPEGWEVESLSKIAYYLNGLAMQKFPSDDESNFINVLKIRELSQGCFDDKSDKGSINTPKEYIIEDGDVIFSWSGTLKVEIWCGGKGALNQHLFKVYSDEYPKWYYYLWTNYHLNEFIRIAEGKATSLGHIKREHLDEALVLVPTSFKKLNPIMNTLIENIICKKLQIRMLIEIKELLLSKLAKIEN